MTRWGFHPDFVFSLLVRALGAKLFNYFMSYCTCRMMFNRRPGGLPGENWVNKSNFNLYLLFYFSVFLPQLLGIQPKYPRFSHFEIWPTFIFLQVQRIEMNKRTPKSLEAIKRFRSVAKDQVVEQKKRENKTKRKKRRSITRTWRI